MFGIREYFQRRAAERAVTRELNAKFEAIKAAMDSGDVKTVGEIAANNDFLYEQITALVLKAIDTDNVRIFNALLNGKNLQGNPNEMLYFHYPMFEGPSVHSESSMLYLAIGSGKTNVAVALATNPKTDITKSGYCETATYHSGGHTERDVDPYQSPLELARKMNMTEVVAPLAQRMAELKQREAAALLQEVRSLAP